MPHAVTQETEEEGTFPFQANVDGFMHLNCTIPEQVGTISLQADVGVQPDSNNYSTSPRSREVCETAEDPAAAKGESIGCRAKQTV